MAEKPLPPPLPDPMLEFAFEAIVTLGPAVKLGGTFNGERSYVPITGGTFSGPNIKGTILPGGWDWQLRRPNGALSIRADYMLKTDDGVVINILNEGLYYPSKEGPPMPLRTSPKFEAPEGRYGWLSRDVFVGTLQPTGDQARPLRLRFYRVVFAANMGRG